MRKVLLFASFLPRLFSYGGKVAWIIPLFSFRSVSAEVQFFSVTDESFRNYEDEDRGVSVFHFSRLFIKFLPRFNQACNVLWLLEKIARAFYCLLILFLKSNRGRLDRGCLKTTDIITDYGCPRFAVSWVLILLCLCSQRTSFHLFQNCR